MSVIPSIDRVITREDILSHILSIEPQAGESVIANDGPLP